MKRICVYHGLGVNEKCLSMLMRCLRTHCDSTFYNVQPISPEEICSGGLDSTVSLLAIGGGYDRGFIKALGPPGIRSIKQYVHGGGRYLGICAGAYFACDYVEFDKDGPLEVCGERNLNFFPGKCVGPLYPGFTYNKEDGAWAARLTLIGRALLQGRQQEQLYCYFNGGGYFDTGPKKERQMSGLKNKNFDILARFSDDSAGDQAAIVRCEVGRNGGLALLSGVHFETDPDYLDTTNPILQHRVLPKLLPCQRQRQRLVDNLLRMLGINTTLTSKL